MSTDIYRLDHLLKIDYNRNDSHFRNILPVFYLATGIYTLADEVRKREENVFLEHKGGKNPEPDKWSAALTEGVEWQLRCAAFRG